MSEEEFEEAIACMIHDGWSDQEIMDLVASVRADMKRDERIIARCAINKIAAITLHRHFKRSGLREAMRAMEPAWEDLMKKRAEQDAADEQIAPEPATSKSR
jgi:ribosomal protein L7/L12